MTTTFEIGTAYGMHCPIICLKRTAKTVTLQYWDGTTETKRISIDSDGDEYVKEIVNSSVIWESEEDRKAREEKEEAERLEAERLARVSVKVREMAHRDVPSVPTEILTVWALSGDLQMLLDHASSVSYHGGMICADPEYNSCTYEVDFDCGFHMMVESGHDQYITHFWTEYLCYSRCLMSKNGEYGYKAETQHPFHHLTADGRWVDEDGKEFQPDWEYMNC